MSVVLSPQKERLFQLKALYHVAAHIPVYVEELNWLSDALVSWQIWFDLSPELQEDVIGRTAHEHF